MVLYVSYIINGTHDRNEIIPSATRFISHHLSTNRTDYAFVFSIVIEHRRRNIMTITGSKFKWAGVGIATNECTKLQQVETLSIHPTDASCISCYFHSSPLHVENLKTFSSRNFILMRGNSLLFHSISTTNNLSSYSI